MKGWVYIISNASLPGLIKIGYSMKDPDMRAAELNHTGVPHRYVVEYEILIENPSDVEARLHKEFSNYHEGKEWFRTQPEQAIKTIKEIYGTSIINEWYKKTKPESVENLIKGSRQNPDETKDVEQSFYNISTDINTMTEEEYNHHKEITIKIFQSRIKEALPGFWYYFLSFFAGLGIGPLFMFFLFPDFSSSNFSLYTLWIFGGVATCALSVWIRKATVKRTIAREQGVVLTSLSDHYDRVRYNS